MKRYLALALGMILLAACTKSPSASPSSFPGTLSVKVSNLKTVVASSHFFRDILSPLLFGLSAVAHNGTDGSPSALSAKFYAAYASPNKDCTNSVLIDESPAGVNLDLFANPELYEATAPAAAQCVIIKMSDQLTFEPDDEAVAHWTGVCEDDTQYRTDFYQSTSATMVDRDGFAVPANGTDAAPEEDAMYIFVSTDPSAVTAGPLAVSNAIQLRTLPAAVSSGVATFYADFSNHLNSRNGVCVLDGHGPFGVR